MSDPDMKHERTVAEIAETGAAWITEVELQRLVADLTCAEEQAEQYRECAFSLEELIALIGQLQPHPEDPAIWAAMEVAEMRIQHSGLKAHDAQ